jgi:hypothetical protein
LLAGTTDDKLRGPWFSAFTSGGAIMAAVVSLLGVPSGCGGEGRVRGISVEYSTGPWDAAIREPAKPAVPPAWAEGAVLDMDEAGRKFRVRLVRGTAFPGDIVEVSTPPDEDPARQILPGGMRGMRVLAGIVKRVDGDVATAEAVAETRAAPLQPGDRAIVRRP